MALSLDYKSFSPDGATKTASGAKWWKESESELPSAIEACISTLQQAQTRIDTQRGISVRLYGNSPVFGVHGMSASKIPTNPAMRDRVTFNLVQSVVDTVQAKIAQNKPKPLILTKRGDYKLQRKAQKLNQFLEGVFYENHAHTPNGPLIFRDAGVLGTGATHVFNYHGRVKYERVLAGELLVDEKEALYGNPRQLHRIKNIDRGVLADFCPQHRKMIMSASGSTDIETQAQPHLADQLTVAESWHLPSGPDAKDGKHVIVINDGVLFSETWEKSYFPFSFYHYSPRMYGFWGQSLAEQLQNLQLEINKMLWVAQRSYHLAGSFKILIEQGSKIVKEQLNNDIGAIITYTGTRPDYIVPPVLPAEFQQRLVWLIQSGYEQAGVSMLSAQSKKPMGLDSGKALREFNDIETDRFQITGQNYQHYFLDLAKLTIATARDIYAQTGKLSVNIPGRKFIESIDWKDVDMEEDQYLMQTFPISSLPNDPEGRLQTIQEYIQAGMIDPRQGRRLLDFPDIDQVEGLKNSVEERILFGLDKIVDEGKFTPPDPFMDLAMARELALQYYNQFAIAGLEEERLDMIRTFMNQVDDLLNKAQPPQMPVAPPLEQPQPMNPGVPGMPPIM